MIARPDRLLGWGALIFCVVRARKGVLLAKKMGKKVEKCEKSKSLTRFNNGGGVNIKKVFKFVARKIARAFI